MRVSVAGKMFAARSDPRLLQLVDDDAAERRDDLRRLADHFHLADVDHAAADRERPGIQVRLDDDDLMGEMFKSAAGVDILHVPYKSGPVPDVIAGRVDMIFDSTGVVVPQIQAGRLRPLAVMGGKRSTGLPEVPSVAEALPGFDALGWVGVMVPAGTPRPIVDRLNKEFRDALEAPQIKQRIQTMLFESAGNTPEQFGAFIKTQSERWAKVIQQAGIKVD